MLISAVISVNKVTIISLSKRHNMIHIIDNLFLEICRYRKSISAKVSCYPTVWEGNLIPVKAMCGLVNHL